MKTKEIRQKFVDYFVSKGHTHVASSPLVPANDPTLLFTNAGMVQFKDVFLGLDKRPYNRAVTAQRCLRAGGKHNDLENVGYTARHHTFFEMLGNFSFGDYFKRDGIRYAWELLTVGYGLPKEKLWTTVYQTDDEAYDIWTKEIGVPKERCIRIGDKPGGRKYESDNFWQMADTGPCGPCSEIFFDHGAGIPGGPPGSPDADGDRYIEIWNLVFMQFNRDEAGNLNPLPKPSVDTGMGLERLTAVLQHKHSNYEIDLFQSLIMAAARETGAKDMKSPSLRVIADHIRACSFLVTDGVIPANEGRGYVLRRIARRAMRHGYKLGQKKPFFYKLVADVVKEMGEAYPELARSGDRVTATLKQEEERFAETLETGMGILESALAKDATHLEGEVAFKLYDTFGFPVDMVADIGRERGFAIDMDAFDAAMAAQQERSRAASKFKAGAQLEYSGAKTNFRGYDTMSEEGPCGGSLPRGRQREEPRRRRGGHRRPRSHAVLCGIRRTGGRPWRAHQGRDLPHALRGARHPEGPARRLRPPRRREDGRARGGRHGRGAGGPGQARAHHAPPLGHAPHAQGAARSARPPRPAEGLARGRGQDPLRLQPQRAHDRGRVAPRGVDRERRGPEERGNQRARDAHR
jgi:alanyl-tRNA synthetase